MKTAIIVAGLSALALAGCATSGPTQTAYAEGQTEFVGWVRFSGEEFQLNANENQVLQPLGRPCVSGALPRDVRRQYAVLANAKVRVTGRTQAWSDDLPGDRLEHAGSIVRNECDGAFVILADSIAPIA